MEIPSYLNVKSQHLTEEEYNAFKINRFNSSQGDFSTCPKCNGRGWFYTIKDTDYGKGMEYLIPCECRTKKVIENRLSMQGHGLTVESSHIKNFKVNYPWQQKMLDKANAFINADKREMFYCSGRSGCGKTTLCNGIWAKFVSEGLDTKYMRWMADTRTLKEYVNTPEYSARFNELVDIDVLYIDDFLKAIGNATPSTADLRLARELIDARLGQGKLTIITSEIPISDLYGIDESLASRIYQSTQHSTHAIFIKEGKNLRMQA